MESQGLSELGRRAQALYERLRPRVETPENLGKIIVLDVESEDWDIDDLGIESAFRLQKKHPDAKLYALKIGYRYAVSFNGSLEPIA
jgi:hypothetical protein